MNSEQIQEAIYQWAMEQGFTAPYGVLTGEHVNKNGRKYRSVTFGRARSLDASVDIYNRNFILLHTSNRGTEVFKDYDSLKARLEEL